MVSKDEMIKIDASAFAIALSHLLPILAKPSNISTLHIFVAEPTPFFRNEFIRTRFSPATLRTSEVEVVKMPGVRKQHPCRQQPRQQSQAYVPQLQITY